jgi:hypothetical protein|tara:strand:- start:144 stop:425 length:282 start_codon:yes stop_codon:yes gene_type:complete
LFTFTPVITKTDKAMRNYLETLLEEKGISQEYLFKAEGDVWGTNIMPLSVIVDYLCSVSEDAQKTAKTNLVKIDFHNGDVKHFFQYVADFLAK